MRCSRTPPPGEPAKKMAKGPDEGDVASLFDPRVTVEPPPDQPASDRPNRPSRQEQEGGGPLQPAVTGFGRSGILRFGRSEERRVGKERSTPLSPYSRNGRGK